MAARADHNQGSHNTADKPTGPRRSQPSAAAAQALPLHPSTRDRLEREELAAIRAAAEVLHVIADTERLLILRALFAGPRTVAELNPECVASETRMYLSWLQTAGLVESQTDGVWRLTARGRQAWMCVRGLL